MELLLSTIDDQQGRAVNMTQYAMFFGFDVMGDVGFSKDFQMLASGQEHPAIVGLHDNMTAVGILGIVPWLMSMLSKIPGATGSYERFTSWCGQQVKEKRHVCCPVLACLGSQDGLRVLTSNASGRSPSENGLRQ